MKFDTARAMAIFEALGDPRFSGPNGEARVAEFVMKQFEASGWNVERREVFGSPWPQRLAPWVGWLGYGGLVTAITVVLVREPSFWVVVTLVPLLLASGLWLRGVMHHRIRPGVRTGPLEEASLLIASSDGDSSAQLRVVFQAILGGLGTDFAQTPRANRLLILALVSGLFLFSLLSKTARTQAPAYSVLLMAIAWAFLALTWAAIFWILFRDHQQSRLMRRSNRPDRRGLSVLMEMARTWGRARPSRVEAVFVAAGGQRLDCAGSREVVRLLGSDWPSRPSLMLIFIAPGAGKDLALCTSATASSRTRELAEDAARSLWIPFRRIDVWDLAPYWPFEKCKPAIALVGSDARVISDNSVDPKALHRAAQLATEIALRWAKQQ